MKSLLSTIGWVLFLILAVVFLLFYNLSYAPKADRIARQAAEIAMWTGQLQEMADSIKTITEWQGTAFIATLSFDELFGGAAGFTLVPTAEASLRAYLPTVQALPGRIEVIGYADAGPVPAKLADRYPGHWEYGAAAAGAVARALISWGVAPSRVSVVSAPEPAPAAAGPATTSSAKGRRIEIVVRNR